MIAFTRIRMVVVVLVVVCTACGHGQFETAKTLPKGRAAITAGPTMLINENIDAHEYYPPTFPSEMNVRFGVGERADMGVGLFLVTGLKTHFKVNLMPPSHRLGVALQSGISGAVLPLESKTKMSWVLRIPVNTIVSIDITNWLTPYIGCGYQFWWIFNRERQPNDQLQPGFEWSKRKGYGDGIVRLLGGLAFTTGARTAIMLEYAALIPVVNDPGDNYKFVFNHHFGIAFLRTFGQ